MARPTGRPLRDELMVEARGLIQRVGIGGFSYGVLAERLGITSPSVHHHFRTKEDLVAQVAASYRADFAELVNAIDASTGRGRLAAYAGLYADSSSKEMLCLCGAVAAEWSTVGEKPRAVVEGFFVDQLAWLTTQLEAGVVSGEFRSDLDVPSTAASLLALLQGSLLLARASSEPELVSTSCSSLLDLLARQPWGAGATSAWEPTDPG